jgi:hypothetical protein
MLMMAAAIPVLASSIWAAEYEAIQKNGYIVSNHPSKITANADSVNGILDGGFAYGTLHCITSAADLDNDDLINSIIVPHLTSSPNAVATIIDSTLAFDVRCLYKALTVSMGVGGDPQQRAMEALERVKMMKVFNFAGLMEAIEETNITMQPLGSNVIEEHIEDVIPQGTIPDSENEEEEDELVKSPSRQDQADETSKKASKAPAGQSPRAHRSNLIIVEDISQVIGPLLRSNYTHGQAQLDRLTKSLEWLTKHHKTCTVLFARASSRPAQETDHQLSQFATCSLRPTLGDHFGYLIDLHIFRYALPIAEMTRRGESRREEIGMRPGSEPVEILEVVEDRYGGRVGRWAAVRHDNHGTLYDAHWSM